MKNSGHTERSPEARPSGTADALVSARQWRSVDELVDSDEIRQWIDREFPHFTELWNVPMKRRTALQMMGASLALAGITGCEQPPAEEIVPYVQPPVGLTPGIAQHYATALTQGGVARGVIVESHTGRPTKVEGNRRHPASLGATDIFAQAAVLGVYDPDRSQAVRNGGQISSWDAFDTDLGGRLAELRARNGAGLYLLTETASSPTMGQQLNDILRVYPEARWHQFDPAGRDAVRQGSILAFGRYLEPEYQLDRADVILSLDGDFLGEHPDRTRLSRKFADRRRNLANMNRLYVVESTPTLTGAVADHRCSLPAGQIEFVTRSLARSLGIALTLPDQPIPLAESWMQAVIRDLERHPGGSLILAGDHQSPAVHALAHAMNERLGNFGHTLLLRESPEIRPTDQWQSLCKLVDEMAAGKVELLVILGGNPVYDAPADLAFGAALQRVPLRVHFGLYFDETASLCHWHIPACHELETWSDARGPDGTASIMQPLMTPLYGGRSVHEFLAWFYSEPYRSSREIVRDYWRTRGDDRDFEQFWRVSLVEGVIPDSAFAAQSVSVLSDLTTRLPPPSTAPRGSLEIRFRPDPTIWDGRYANNAWLQELPKPLTKLTWGNAALISPTTARERGIENGQRIELGYRNRTLVAPAWITPGHPDGSVTLHLGHGRERCGRVGDGVGVNASQLRTSSAPWFDYGLSIRVASSKSSWFDRLTKPDRLEPSTTQLHHAMNGHELVRVLTQAEWQTGDGLPAPAMESLYPAYPRAANAWGMVIDLTACTGCSACVVACQAENNIPVVGKDEVLRGREMHWLRVDRYYSGSPENPKTHFQPVPCMQCENAPCEPVCPVHASVHDSEGINNQVYNRCVGTRFCQSNCPYKVRRFNFFEYSGREATNEGTPIMAALRNPDVTVRSRGVMEKCTYCIQRISRTRIRAEKENRPIRDGEVVTACQAACPARAIAFGNINDPLSEVSASRRQPHHYALLAELNTRPRTTYLAKVTNPNPEIDDG